MALILSTIYSYLVIILYGANGAHSMRWSSLTLGWDTWGSGSTKAFCGKFLLILYFLFFSFFDLTKHVHRSRKGYGVRIHRNDTKIVQPWECWQWACNEVHHLWLSCSSFSRVKSSKDEWVRPKWVWNKPWLWEEPSVTAHCQVCMEGSEAADQTSSFPCMLRGCSSNVQSRESAWTSHSGWMDEEHVVCSHSDIKGVRFCQGWT